MNNKFVYPYNIYTRIRKCKDYKQCKLGLRLKKNEEK